MIGFGPRWVRFMFKKRRLVWHSLLLSLSSSYFGLSTMENPTTDTERRSVVRRQVTLVKRRGRGRLPKSQPITEQPKFQPGTLQFINSAHPDEITNANSIRLIRSHAAKLSRALQKKKQQDEAPLEGDNPENVQAKTELRSVVHPAINKQYRKIIPKTKVHEQTGNHPPSPIQLIGGARSAAYTGFARPLSDDEHYLFDFCTSSSFQQTESTNMLYHRSKLCYFLRIYCMLCPRRRAKLYSLDETYLGTKCNVQSQPDERCLSRGVPELCHRHK